jgi:hypothetical protein
MFGSIKSTIWACVELTSIPSMSRHTVLLKTEITLISLPAAQRCLDRSNLLSMHAWSWPPFPLRDPMNYYQEFWFPPSILSESQNGPLFASGAENTREFWACLRSFYKSSYRSARQTGNSLSPQVSGAEMAQLL